MATTQASAVWNGTLKEGNGTMKLPKGNYEGPFTYASRFENGKGTNPEELIGAAHAGCFSMFLSAQLAGADHPPKSIQTTATVHMNNGAISLIELETVGDVPGLSPEQFQEFAEKAKAGCPVSKALSAVQMKLTARLS
jgi:lipoyl-dependent peroxiredoxin